MRKLQKSGRPSSLISVPAPRPSAMYGHSRAPPPTPLLTTSQFPGLLKTTAPFSIHTVLKWAQLFGLPAAITHISQDDLILVTL